jgi:hypothetical protein
MFMYIYVYIYIYIFIYMTGMIINCSRETYLMFMYIHKDKYMNVLHIYVCIYI